MMAGSQWKALCNEVLYSHELRTSWSKVGSVNHSPVVTVLSITYQSSRCQQRKPCILGYPKCAHWTCRLICIFTGHTCPKVHCLTLPHILGYANALLIQDNILKLPASNCFCKIWLTKTLHPPDTTETLNVDWFGV